MSAEPAANLSANLSDEQLMRRYQLQDDGLAFELLYARHSPKVWRYLRLRCRGADPGLRDDLFQQVFLKLHRSRGRYDAKYPFVAWLFVISRGVVLDWERSRARSRERAEPGVIEHASATEEPSRTELPVLDGLPETQRRAIELRYGAEERSFEEIARVLGVSTGTARQWVSRGIRKLRANLRPRSPRSAGEP